MKALKIIESSYDQEYQEDPEPSEQMEMYCGREKIWKDKSKPPIYIEWFITESGEKVDYYAYIQAGEDGDISSTKELTWWETSLKN